MVVKLGLRRRRGRRAPVFLAVLHLLLCAVALPPLSASSSLLLLLAVCPVQPFAPASKASAVRKTVRRIGFLPPPPTTTAATQIRAAATATTALRASFLRNMDGPSAADAITSNSVDTVGATADPHFASAPLNGSAPPSTGVVRWDDLLVARRPIDCDEDDEVCLILQHMPLDDDRALVSPQTTRALSRTAAAGVGLSAAAAAAAVVGLLVVLSGPGAWRYYLSGGVCAAASHAIPVPIDTVKTRRQIDPEFARLRFGQAFQRIVQREGVSGLLAGLGPTAVGYLFEGAIKFGVYEGLKPVVCRALSRAAAVSPHLAVFNVNVVAYALSAAAAGVAAAIMLCPMEALRIRIVANPQQSKTGGWLGTGYSMLKTEGFAALSKGMLPMLYKQVPYTVTKNVSFDLMTRCAYAALLRCGSAVGPLAKVAVPLAAAAATSVLSCVTSQPGDMLLSLVNARTGDQRRTRDIVRDILKSDRGLAGFFVGMQTRFLHVGVIVTLQLLIYDFVKRLCGIAATGTA